MRIYATLSMRSLTDPTAYPTISYPPARRYYDWKHDSTGFQEMLNDGWKIVTAAIKTQVCNDQVSYEFILEKDIEK